MASRLNPLNEHHAYSTPDLDPEESLNPSPLISKRFSDFRKSLESLVSSTITYARTLSDPNVPPPVDLSRIAPISLSSTPLIDEVEDDRIAVSSKPSPLVDDDVDDIWMKGDQLILNKGLTEDVAYINKSKHEYSKLPKTNHTHRLEEGGQKLQRPLCITDDKTFFLILNDGNQDEVIVGGAKVFSQAIDIDSGNVCACLDASIGDDEPIHTELYIYGQLKSLNFAYSTPVFHTAKYSDESGCPRIRVFVPLCQKSLENAIKGEKKLNKSEQDRLFIQAGLVLCEFLGLGFVHRDIKAGNFLIDDRNKVLLVDFDTAGQQGKVGNLETSSFFGTNAYAAPETVALQLLDIPGPRPNVLASQTDKADIYAYGLVALELYGKLNIKEIQEKHHDGVKQALEVREEIVKILGTLPPTPEFELIKKMLEEDPKKRINLEQLKIELKRVRGNLIGDDSNVMPHFISPVII